MFDILFEVERGSRRVPQNELQLCRIPVAVSTILMFTRFPPDGPFKESPPARGIETGCGPGAESSCQNPMTCNIPHGRFLDTVQPSPIVLGTPERSFSRSAFPVFHPYGPAAVDGCGRSIRHEPQLALSPGGIHSRRDIYRPMRHSCPDYCRIDALLHRSGSS